MQGATLRQYEFRKLRTRAKIRESRTLRPRLSVIRTLNHIYAQIIDDGSNRTLLSVSSLSPELKGKLKSGGNIPAAQAVGKLVAEKAVGRGVKAVVFDRGGHVYHGRIKALAEAARQAGLEF